MDPDREICLCFHVTARKILHFVRVEKPHRASQLSQCFGAGTGCGWCRPFLVDLFESARSGSIHAAWPEAEQYARLRQAYRQNGPASPADPPSTPPEE